jgi:S-DNA-T family DNA segregation ATPase FtsK/SpoIIIE
MNNLMIGGVATGVGLLFVNMAFPLPGLALLGGTIASAGVSALGMITNNMEESILEPDTETRILERQLVEILHLKNIALDRFKITEKKDYEDGYILTIPTIEGLSSMWFEKFKVELNEYFDASVKVTYDNSNTILDVRTKKLLEKYKFELIRTASPTEIIIGYSAKGIVKIDLRTAHNVLIAGTAGYGKSTLERCILTTLICNNKPSDLCINLVDLKIVELGIFKQSNMVNTFCRDTERLGRLLERLEEESLRRYDMFEKENILDIGRWNEKHPDKKLRYVITFVDEFAQLGGKKNSKIMDAFQKRLALDRAAGLFYVLCTQRPSAEIITGDIKANLDTRISFKVIDSTNAWIVMDQERTAELLKIPGRGLIKCGGDIEEFHGMFLDEAEAINLVKHTFTKGGQGDDRA